MTFSAAGVGLLSASLLTTFILLKLRIRNSILKIRQLVKVGVVFTFFGAAVWASFQPLVQDFMTPIFMKLTLSDGIRSSEHRLDRWEEGSEIALDRPFLGYGPRYFSGQGQISPLNWYLMLLVEGGFLSLVFIILFLLLVMWEIIRFRHPSRMPILVGFLAGAGHLLVISTFQHPFLWMLIAIFFVLKARLSSNTTCNYGAKYINVK